MRRIAGTYVDEDEFGSGKHGFRSGDPVADPPVLPTIITEQFLDDLQETLLHPIEQEGITPGADYDQLTLAITSIADAAALTPETVTTESVVINTLNASTTDTINIKGAQSSGASAGATIEISSTPGTIETPTSAVLNTELGRVGFGGHNGTTWLQDKSYMSATAQGTWSSSVSSNLVFATTNGGTTSTKMTIVPNGDVQLTNNLTVSGTSLLTSGVSVGSSSDYIFSSAKTFFTNQSFFSARVAGTAPTFAVSASSPVTWSFNSSTTIYLHLDLVPDCTITAYSLRIKSGSSLTVATVQLFGLPVVLSTSSSPYVSLDGPRNVTQTGSTGITTVLFDTLTISTTAYRSIIAVITGTASTADMVPFMSVTYTTTAMTNSRI